MITFRWRRAPLVGDRDYREAPKIPAANFWSVTLDGSCRRYPKMHGILLYMHHDKIHKSGLI